MLILILSLDLLPSMPPLKRSLTKKKKKIRKLCFLAPFVIESM
jgi:hypothetical protein